MIRQSVETKQVLHKGCALSYRITGCGPPVLLIQGAGLHGDGWTPQTATLSSHYTCISFDNRGVGLSQPQGAPLTVAQMAEDALAIMDAEGWESAHIVGHSMGGLIAQHVALTARKRVRGLSLLCTFAYGRDATKLSARIIWAGLKTRVGSRLQRRRAFLQLVMTPEFVAASDQDDLAARMKPVFGHDLADQPAIAMRQLSAIRPYESASRLGELKGLPVLVVTATHDRIARPEFGRALAAGIPGARYVEISDAAHGVTIQCADRVNALLMNHFSASGEI